MHGVRNWAVVAGVWVGGYEQLRAGQDEGWVAVGAAGWQCDETAMRAERGVETRAGGMPCRGRM